MAYDYEYARIDAQSSTTVSGFKIRPGLLVKAFAVFGTFTVAGIGAGANFFGHALSQPDLAFYGFIGGIVGAFYAAIVDRKSPDNR